MNKNPFPWLIRGKTNPQFSGKTPMTGDELTERQQQRRQHGEEPELDGCCSSVKFTGTVMSTMNYPPALETILTQSQTHEPSSFYKVRGWTRHISPCCSSVSLSGLMQFNLCQMFPLFNISSFPSAAFDPATHYGLVSHSLAGFNVFIHEQIMTAGNWVFCSWWLC